MIDRVTPNDFTINISAPNAKLIEYETHNARNVVFEVFRPKEGVKIGSVSDRQYHILKELRELNRVIVTQKDNLPYMISVYITEDESHYFIRSNETWAEITYEEFQNRLSSLGGRPTSVDGIKIDINKQNADEYYGSKTDIDEDTKHVTFTPRNKSVVHSVVSGENTVWRAENEAQLCPVAGAFYYKDQPVLVHLTLHDNCTIKWRYYQSVDDKWIELTSKEYFKEADRYCPWFSLATTVVNSVFSLITPDQ